MSFTDNIFFLISALTGIFVSGMIVRIIQILIQQIDVEIPDFSLVKDHVKVTAIVCSCYGIVFTLKKYFS